MKTIDSRERRPLQSASGAGGVHGRCDTDIFLSRLRLLIIMGNAYLCGCPFGNFRKKAAAENSNHVFYRSMTFFGTSNVYRDPGSDESSESAGKETTLPVNEFRQRVQGLAHTVHSIAQNRPLDLSETKTLRDNLNAISKALSFSFEIDSKSFLRAA